MRGESSRPVIAFLDLPLIKLQTSQLDAHLECMNTRAKHLRSGKSADERNLAMPYLLQVPYGVNHGLIEIYRYIADSFGNLATFHGHYGNLIALEGLLCQQELGSDKYDAVDPAPHHAPQNGFHLLWIEVCTGY
jgi:hypothetical protein